MQSGRNPKKRSRPERQESPRGDGRGEARADGKPASSTAPVDANALLARYGIRWSGLAAVLAAGFFFWTWLFLDSVPGRGYALLALTRPDDLLAQWMGNFGQGAAPFGFFDRWPIVLAAGFILLASVGPGSLLVSLLTGSRVQDKVEHLVLAIGAGLNLASLFVLAGGISAAGSLHQPWWIWLGLLIGLLLSPVAIWQLIKPAETVADGDAETATPEALSLVVRCTPWIIGLFSLPYLFGGMLPPTDFDVREYHLQAPKEWMQRGQIDFLPHNVYANMPLGVELHAITATAILGSGDEAWWLGGLTGKLIVSLFAPLTSVLLWCIGRRCGNPTVGLVAAVCYLTLPWIANVSLNGLNDAVLGYYLLACWWVWWRSEAGDWRALVLAGFFGGAAAAVKYPALVFVVLPLVVETVLRKLGLRGAGRVEWVGLRHFGNAAVAIVLLFIGGMLGGGLWYAKNARLTGNPVYPLLASRLGGETRMPEKDARWVKAHAVPQDAQGRRFTLAQLATKIRDFAIGNDGEGRLASPLLVPLALLGCVYVVQQWWLLPRAKSASLMFPLLAIGLVGFIFAAWFLITHRLDRFLVPALPLLALLAGFGYLFAKEGAGSAVARTFLAVGLLYSLMFIALATPETRWLVALNHLRSDPLLSDDPKRPLPQRLTPAQRWLNQHISGGEGVLMVGGASVWDLNGKTQAVNVYYNTCFDDCLLLDWRDGKKPDEVEKFREEFQSRGVNYVCVDWVELKRYLQPGNYGYDRRFSAKNSLRMFNNFENTLVLKTEARLGPEIDFLGEAKRPAQVIYRVLTAAEAAAERARQKEATKNIKPTPKAAPPKSANQSRKSD